VSSETGVPPVLLRPEHESLESPCEVCGAGVVYSIHRASPGAPEFVNVRSPETALLGWMDGGAEHPEHVKLLLLCSRVCLLAFRDGSKKEPS
jgi:hypothetical protein